MNSDTDSNSEIFRFRRIMQIVDMWLLKGWRRPKKQKVRESLSIEKVMKFLSTDKENGKENDGEE
jgi:hypothetical protein